MAGWNADTAAGPVGSGTVTLVEGSSFCISLANGDMHPEHPHGVFHEDTRILSRWNLSVNGQPLEPLTAATREPYRALFIGRVPRSDGYADSPLIGRGSARGQQHRQEDRCRRAAKSSSIHGRLHGPG